MGSLICVTEHCWRCQLILRTSHSDSTKETIWNFGTDCFVDLGVVNYWRGKICRAQMHCVINCGYNSIKAASFRLLVLVLTRNRGHWKNSQFITRPVHIHLHGNSQCFRGSYSIFSTAVISWSFWTSEWTSGIFVNWATKNLLDIVAKAAFTKIRQWKSH